MASPPNDVISIHQLTLFVRVGCSDEERTFPQRLVIDIEATVDIQKAAQTGELADTVCYISIANETKKLVEHGSWKLLEEFAEETAALLFKKFEQISKLSLCITKQVIPDAAGVSLQIRRARE